MVFRKLCFYLLLQHIVEQKSHFGLAVLLFFLV